MTRTSITAAGAPRPSMAGAYQRLSAQAVDGAVIATATSG
jgi:hypothetical protein